MPFITKLFRIVVSNGYYKSHSDLRNDFDIEPTALTASWMAQRGIRILDRPDGIELVWLSQGYDTPLELFKKKSEGVVLSFVMVLKNSRTLNLSDLESGYATGETYYLHNGYPNNLMHSKASITKSDLVKVKDLPHYPTHPGPHVFALIDVDFSHWTRNVNKQKTNLFFDPVTYKIKIQNRATFWRYYLVDTKKRLNGVLQILSKGNDSYFTDVKVWDETPNTYCAESTMPIDLYDTYDHSFSLCSLDTSVAKNEITILEKLPYPTYDSLKKDGSNKKKLYSDIVVYV